MSDVDDQILPKVCAVCGQVCDRNAKQEWLHTLEIVGKSDHVCIPVDYDMVKVVTRCDFCYRVVLPAERWTVPCQDFQAPLLNNWLLGGWACDADCAAVAARRDWTAMAERHFSAPDASVRDEPIYRGWLSSLYTELERNMIGEPRPWRAGDEKVDANPKGG